uniref:UDP-N-acetylglucosamine transferase subunit ALG13 n=1 Tax=Romanomermis culicivorax TaxID=13658 RepID=A0A915KKL3_ROMCU
MKKLFQNVFVTVGTTAFDDLIAEITNPVNLKLLSELGCRKLLLQIGRGEESCVNSAYLENSSVHVEYYRFKPSLKNDLQSADLVIGHAGAGTCLEKRGHLIYCTPKSLSKVLSDQTLFSNLQVFRPGNPKLFTNWLDDYLGFNH